MSDSPDYEARQREFRRLLTIYGRKAVLEALQDNSLDCQTLHLANSNRPAAILDDIINCAQRRQVSQRHHDKQGLSRISRNGRQDQGVALDIACPRFQDLPEYLSSLPASHQRLLALDGISNPQNLGMIVRSAVAAGIDGIIWTRRGNAAPGPLVIKSSVGTLFRAPILHAADLPSALSQCQAHGFSVATLAADAAQTVFDYRAPGNTVYVLGNETEGVSADAQALADVSLSIPMAAGVESLNVAVTAALVAYATRD